MTAPAETLHASAVLIGAKAALIRGPSGSGKSRLVLELVQAAGSGLPFTRLVADDRVVVEAVAGALLMRPPPALAGLIEVRGLGIRIMAYEPVAVVGLVVDLAAKDAMRLPDKSVDRIEIFGVQLPRLALPEGADAVAPLLAALQTFGHLD